MGELAALQLLAQAQHAYDHVDTAIKLFRKACMAADWESAERARLVAIASFEAFLDQNAAVFKEIARG
jgi:hypothetical protein